MKKYFIKIKFMLFRVIKYFLFCYIDNIYLYFVIIPPSPSITPPSPCTLELFINCKEKSKLTLYCN